MLQIKNIKPNSLTNTPLILDEENMGTFSFELEGNEDIDSYGLVFTNLHFDIKEDFSSTDPSFEYSNNLKEDYPDIDYTTPISVEGLAIQRPDLPDFPSTKNLKLFLTFNYSFTLRNNSENFNVLLGNHKISYSFSIPYKIYCTHNGDSSSSLASYKERRILSSQNIEESNNIIEFSDDYYIYNNQNEEFINITGSQIIDLSESFNSYLEDDIGNESLAVYSDGILITEPVGSFLKEYEYFPKFSFSFNNDSFLPLYDDGYSPRLGTDVAYGALIYLLSPILTIDNIVSEKKYEKEIDKPYKNYLGENNTFSFNIEINDYLKKAEKFYIDLSLKNNKEITLTNGQKGIYLGDIIPSDASEETGPGDFYSIIGNRCFSLPVSFGEKYIITTKLLAYTLHPAINFYNNSVPNNQNYVGSIYGHDRIETFEIIIPENVNLITINNNSTNGILTIEKANVLSSTVNYEYLEKPKLIDNGLVLEGSPFSYDYSLSFYLNGGNSFPLLWYRFKIYNYITEKNKVLLSDSGEIFTTAKEICITPIHLLPDEKYCFELQFCDTKNILSDVYSLEHETSKTEEKINFSEQKIVKYTSESFVKLDLDKFGIGQKGIYPAITLYPEDVLYPLDETFEEFKYTKIKILREDLITKQAVWIDEQEWEDKEPTYSIYDYGVKANTPYNYWAYVWYYNEDSLNHELKGVLINSEPIVAEWDRWTLVTADKDPKDEKVYHVDKVFTFEMNLSSGSMTNGTNITMSKNFTEFPIIQKDKSNFYSGSLTALIGVRRNGSTAEDFEQTPHMLEELRQLSTNYQPKFLKDRSGHLWQVEINGAIQVANTDNLATIDLKTMTVPWVQIGEADDISLIYTGTELKEELYC